MKQYISKVLPKIEEAVSKHFPSEITKEWVDANIGSHGYSFDADAWKEAIYKPFFELYSRGGKRLRPVLCCLIHDALGGSEQIYDLAILPELLHTGSLIIDDMEDRSELRRGKPVVHSIFGESTSINAGNFLYFYPFSILSRLNIPDEKKLKIYDVLTQEMVRLHLGQGMDIFWSSKKKYDISIEQYLQMCEYKTSSMVNVALKIGSIMAGKDMNEIDELSSNVGIAFQIRDDILNLKPTSSWTKEAGEDITEGKLTYLVAHTMSKAGEEDKAELKKILCLKTKDKEEIKRAIKIMDKYNAFDRALQFAKELISSAKEIVNDILDGSEYRQVFLEMLDYVVEREK